MRMLSIITGLLLLSSLAQGQRFPVTNYSIREGLPHSTVYRIFQDSKSFLWFCTDYGLTRFDGRSFETGYRDEKRLLNTSVFSLFESPSGYKLAGTTKGLLLLSDTGVRKYSHKGPYNPKPVIFSLEHQGRTWMVANDTIAFVPSLYVIERGITKRFDIRDRFGKAAIFSSIVKEKNELLICSTAGAFSVKDSVLRPLYPGLDQAVFAIHKPEQNDYWFGIKDRLLRLHRHSLSIFPLPVGLQLNTFFIDNAGDIWISPKEGGLLLLKDSSMKDVSNLLGPGRPIVTDIFQDFEGNIWFATYGSGVYRLDALKTARYENQDGESNIFCRALAEVGGELVIGSVGRLAVLKKDRLAVFDLRLLKSSYYVYFVRQIDHRLYAGTSNGLIVKDLLTGRESIRREGATSICRSRDKTIWISSYNYLCRLTGDTLQKYPMPAAAGRRRYNLLYEDSGRNLWCGTGSGAFFFNPCRPETPPHFLPGLEIVQDILEDKTHRIWIATSNGLAIWDGRSARMVTKADGLSSDNVSALAEDSNGVLWIGTANGLNYLLPGSLSPRAFPVSNFREVVLSLCLKRPDMLFVGTSSGLLSIDVNKIKAESGPPPLYITHIRVRGKEVKDLNMLPYGHSQLAIDYIGLSYQMADLVSYKYRVLPMDKTWRYTTNTSLELSALPSGKLVFELSVRKNKGAWSKPLKLPIYVTTPMWKTWWFLLAVVIVSGACFSFLIRYLILKKEKKKRDQLLMHNKVAHLKQQALNAMINPHFIFNCMNSIQHFLDQNDNDSANTYLADFADLIRATLEDAQSEYISLGREMERIRLYLELEQLRFGDDMQFSIDVEGGIDTHVIFIPNMMLQPYVENAIWHGIMPNGGTGRVSVLVGRTEEGTLLIGIEDNGIGIDRSRSRRKDSIRNGLGMKITLERLQILAELAKQEFKVNVLDLSREGRTGTRIEISLPYRTFESVINDTQAGSV